MLDLSPPKSRSTAQQKLEFLSKLLLLLAEDVRYRLQFIFNLE